MKTPIELALFRIECVSQLLHDSSKKGEIGLQEWHTLTATMTHLAHCCAVLAAAVQTKQHSKIEIENAFLTRDTLPLQYLEEVKRIEDDVSSST